MKRLILSLSLILTLGCGSNSSEESSLQTAFIQGDAISEISLGLIEQKPGSLLLSTTLDSCGLFYASKASPYNSTYSMLKKVTASEITVLRQNIDENQAPIGDPYKYTYQLSKIFLEHTMHDINGLTIENADNPLLEAIEIDEDRSLKIEDLWLDGELYTLIFSFKDDPLNSDYVSGRFSITRQDNSCAFSGSLSYDFL